VRSHGIAALPRSDLVDASVSFERIGAGRIRIFFLPSNMRLQLRARNSRRQFAAYRATRPCARPRQFAQNISIFTPPSPCDHLDGRIYGMRACASPPNSFRIGKGSKRPAQAAGWTERLARPPRCWLSPARTRAGFPARMLSSAWPGGRHDEHRDWSGFSKTISRRAQRTTATPTKDGFAGEAPRYRYGGEIRTLVSPFGPSGGAQCGALPLGGYAGISRSRQTNANLQLSSATRFLNSAATPRTTCPHGRARKTTPGGPFGQAAVRNAANCARWHAISRSGNNANWSVAPGHALFSFRGDSAIAARSCRARDQPSEFASSTTRAH